MNSLKPIHLQELNKNLGYTQYGIVCQNADDLGKVFANDQSYITLDYDDVMEKDYDEY